MANISSNIILFRSEEQTAGGNANHPKYSQFVTLTRVALNSRIFLQTSAQLAQISAFKRFAYDGLDFALNRVVSAMLSLVVDGLVGC